MIHSGDKVLSRDGKLTGQATGATYPCRMAGCRGLRMVVKWPDGTTTHPCTAGMTLKARKWRIL